MFTARRWWDRYGSQLILTGIVLGTGWFLRQTQAAPIAELYYQLVSPFQADAIQTKETALTNARTIELQNRVSELEKQNQNLQKLLGYVKSQPQKVINAPIVGRSADYWWQQITVGKGSVDGIKVGFAVTGTGGLVGRIVAVTPHTSRILLISDPTSRVGVTINRSRYMGFLEGKSSSLAKMRFFEKVSDVRPGDLITTSSVSRLFPGGIPIGKIKSVNLNNGPSPEATVELTAPLNYLEWVVIHPFETQEIPKNQEPITNSKQPITNSK